MMEQDPAQTGGDAPLLDETLDEPAGDPSEPAGAAEPPRDRFAPGAMIGHFRIVRELGAGGMGVVLEAYDPDLDRRVAIKVVRGEAGGARDGGRLLREAQAMAKLAHPNVVGVHEVGTVDGQVFVVMELVRGDTLAAWLDAEQRSWRQLVEVFTAAGEGLVAAHHAGLVHRDFKPSNVLIDRSGRARVTDFGLAFSDDEPRLALGSDAAGTPAFMPPEQRTGGPVDARADQYAFARSLAYALEPAHAIGTAPRRVRAAIARALAEAPADRFPALADMLVELRLALRSRRRAMLAIAAGAAALAAAAIPLAESRAEDSCAMGADLVDEVWPVERSPLDQFPIDDRFPIDRFPLAGPTGRPGSGRLDGGRPGSGRLDGGRPGSGRLDGGWPGSGQPDGGRLGGGAAWASSPTVTRSTAEILDEWVAAWRLGRRGACGAGRDHRPARLACLDRSLEDLRQQLHVWRAADAEAVDRAVDAALALPRPEACAATIPPRAQVPAPLGERAARVHALVRAGRSRDAQAEAAPLVQLAEITGHPAGLAIALLASGAAAHAAGDHAAARTQLARAATEAGRAGDDASLIDALLLQAAAVIDAGRPLDSLGLLDAAGAIAARITGAQAGAQADAARDLPERLELARGDALVQAGRVPEGIEELRRAVGRLEARATRDPSTRLALARALGVLAGAHSKLRQYEQGRELLARALPIEEAALGTEHPEVGKTLTDLAGNEARLERYDVAQARLGRARAIFVGAHGEDHALVGGTDLALGNTALFRGALEEARGHYERGLAILARVLPPDHPNLAVAASGLGSVERELERCAAAIPHFERAIGIYERSGTDGPVLALQLVNLSACLVDLDRRPEARRAVEKAVALMNAAGIADRDQIEAWMVLAELDASDGRRTEAIARVQKLLAVTDAVEGAAWEQLRTYARERLADWSR